MLKVKAERPKLSLSSIPLRQRAREFLRDEGREREMGGENYRSSMFTNWPCPKEK